MKVRWSKEGLKSLDIVKDFNCKISKAYAESIQAEIFFAIDQLSGFPFSGQVEISVNSRKEVRYLVCRHYKILYFIEDNYILIFLVFDTRQNPDKMKKALKSI